MPLDLRAKDELRAYAYVTWKMKHIAFNYFDLVHDSLDASLRHEEKMDLLKKLIDWWASPEYLESLKGDHSPSNVLETCKRYAKRIEEELVNEKRRRGE